MLIGRQIARLRLERGMTQKDLAKAANLGQSTISCIESGDRDPTLSTIEQLCNALSISLAELFSGEATIPYTGEDSEVFKRLFALSHEQKLLVFELIDEFYRSNEKKKPKTKKEYVKAVLGNAAAGVPLINPSYDSDYISVPAKYAGNNYILIRAQGDSMDPSILDNDIVVVHRDQVPYSGEVALVLVKSMGEDEYTIKRYYENDDTVELVSENFHYPPLIYKKCDIVSARKVVDVIHSRSKQDD